MSGRASAAQPVAVECREHDRPIRILLYGSSYWKEVLNFEALARYGMISPEDLDLFAFVDDPAQALGLLQSWLEPEPARATPAFAASHPDGQEGP